MSAKHAQNPRIRPPMSEEQRAKLSAAQKRYVATDPRWPEHRQKLADTQGTPEQRVIHSETQHAYIDNDPRWPEHRARMQEAALEATRLTLLPEEVEKIIAERKKGRTFEYLAEELCVDAKVIRRELQSLGIHTGRILNERRAKQGNGYWRSFDPA